MASFVCKKNGDSVNIAISGRFTLHDKIDFQTMMADVKEQQGKTLCFDVRAMDYIDSSGIGDLIKVKMDSGKGFDRLLVYGMSEAVARSFRVSGLLQLFEQIDDEQFHAL